MRKLLLAGTAVAVVMAAGSAGAADLAVRSTRPRLPDFGLQLDRLLRRRARRRCLGHEKCPIRTCSSSVKVAARHRFFPDTTINNYGVNGFLGGVQIGYNYQSGPWVWGVEAQASWAGIRGSDACPFFGGKAPTCKSNVDALGSFAVRFGGTIDRAMLYVKGGLAWAYERHKISGPGDFDGFGAFSVENKHWRWGGMLGAGVEFAFTNSISGKLEYNYMDFGTRTYTFVIAPIGDSSGHL